MSSAGGGGRVEEARDLYAVLATGPWEAARVRSRLVRRAAVRSAEAEGLLARAWEDAVARARETGQTLFPGPVYGVADWRVRPGAAGESTTLELDFHATDYREFVGTNLSPPYLALAREQAPRADALGISVVILSGDRVVLHRRGAGCYEWPLAVDTPGGHMEPGKHEEDGRPSPLRCALDELEAELGIRPDEVLHLRALALTRLAATEKPQLVLAARISLEPAAIAERLASAREGFETSELLPVRLADLERVERERVTPAGRAGLRFARALLSHP